MTLTVMEHATCIACGCVCDDIEVHTDHDRIVRTEGACDLGRGWFAGHAPGRSPEAVIDGRSVTVEEGIRAAGHILRRATYPLVYGLGQSTCEAAREAVALAEWSGGVLDSHTSLTHGPTKTAAQLVGKVVCTL